eukprot:gene7857-9222_t
MHSITTTVCVLLLVIAVSSAIKVDLNKGNKAPLVRPHRISYDRHEPVKPKLTAENLKYISDRDDFVKKLMAKMSIVEKIGQMTQIDVDIVLEPLSLTVNETLLAEYAKTYNIGSFLNSPVANGVLGDIHYLEASDWIKLINTVQNITMANSPNKIPMLYAMDSMHGAGYVHKATMFPHNTGLAATFNPPFAQASNYVSAKDTSAAGLRWAEAPVLGIGHQPLWSRIYETFGEDPFLASAMGRASVMGFQNNLNPFTGPISAPYVVSTAKHFFGYSDPVSGKDRTPAWIPERMLRRYFLPSFAAAFDTGIGTVMFNSGEINGIPMHASKKYGHDLLREELEYDGVVCTDWEDIEKLTFFHHLAADNMEAIAYALDASIDLSMVPDDFSFSKDLLTMVQQGLVPESRIDESVRRLLNLKYCLGLFDNPYADPNNPWIATLGSAEDRDLAAKIAAESITLLANPNNTLPLDISNMYNVLVTGPGGNSLTNQNGGWTVHWQGAISDAEIPFGTTVFDGVKSVLKANSANVMYEVGTEIGVINQTLIKSAVKHAKYCDAIIICLAEHPEAETPGDINDLTMDDAQLLLITSIRAATSAPIILVLIEARPRIIPASILSQVDGVIMAYLPGSEGGQPIADTIFGLNNPSGKLPLTYPATTGDLVPYYYKYSQQGFTYPAFEFGHGLSYTTYNYTDIACVGNCTANLGESVTVTVTVTNTGKVAGKESVLMFLSDLYASITPEVKMLRGFNKVFLNPGDSMLVSFTLTNYDFSFIGEDNKVTIEAGQFIVAIGTQQITINLI